MHLEKQLKIAVEKGDVLEIDHIFERVYYEYGHLVAFIISKYVFRKEDVEELVDDVFVALFQKIKIESVNNLKYYLVTIAKNKAIDFLRHQKKTVDISYDEEYIFKTNDESSALYGEIIEMLQSILTDYEINVILLKDYYCHSLSSIARFYNKPVRTVNSTYHTALKKVKRGVKK